MKATHSIITYGGGETLELIFNAIAALFGDSEFKNAMHIAATLFGFWVIVMAAARNSGFIPLKWFGWFVIATELILLPKATVMIVDPLTKFERPVANVPYLLGSFASAVSNVGAVLTYKMETYFSLPDYLHYHETGTLFASKLFEQMHQFKVNNGVLQANLHRFVQNCVVYDAMVGYKYTLKDLKESNDILTLVSDTSTIVGFLYQTEEGGSKIVNCKEGIGLIKKELAKETSVVASRLGSKLGLGRFFNDNPSSGSNPNNSSFLSNIFSSENTNQSPTIDPNINNAVKVEFLSKLSNSYNFMSKISRNGEDILKQEMMINAIQDASKNKAEELGSPHSYAATKALMQQRSTYHTVGELAKRTLAVTKVVFEALAYSAFIFVAMLALLPNGLQIVMNYLGLLMWIQLWAPLYAVLNLIMNVAARNESIGILGGKGITMLTAVGFANLHADMQATAGWISMAIPFVSYGIIRGGVGSFMQLSSSLSSGYQSAASSASSEVVSGNMSMGNISYNNSSVHGFSGFKHDSNYSYQSGRMETMNSDGTVSFMTPSGGLGFKGGAGLTTSTWEHQLNMQQGLSAMTQSQMQNETSKLASLNHEYSEAQSNGLRNATDFLQRMQQSGSSSGSWSTRGSAEQVAAASDTVNFVNELQGRFGLSSTQAAEVAAGISMGGSLNGVGANVSANWRSSNDYQAALSKGKQLADSMGVSESLSKTLSRSDQFSFTENEQYEQGLAKNISGSLDKMKGLRDSISISEQKVHRLSSMESFVNSNSANLTKDMSQDLIKLIADQPGRGTYGGNVGKIGMDTAHKIVRSQGDDYEMYLGIFMNKKFEEVYNHVPNVPRGNVYNDSANNINNTSNSGNNGNAASSDNYTSSSNSNAGRVSFESTESLPAVRTEPVYNEAMNQAQPTSSSGGQVQQSSSSKQEERSLAQDAKEWHGRESRFVKGHDISYPSPYENINKQADKAFQAQSALPSTLAGIDVSGSNYKQLREGIVSKVGIGTASKETGKVIAENTGDLGKNINKDIYSNLKDLSNHYGASGDKGLIQEVQSSYTQSADGIKKVKDKITNENQNLSEQYQKETKWLIPVNVSPKIVESKKEDNKENK